jgi:hypothetical protein
MFRQLLLTILSLVWIAVLLLVGGRFLALLINANRDSELVQRLYSSSEFWVQPFFGVLNLSNKTVDRTGGVFEPASLLAFIAYFLVGLLVLRLIASVTRGLVHRHFVVSR